MGSSNNKPMLTIALPTYNAGHRALEFTKHILQCPYDETQIEILVSENCSQINREPYAEIRAMKDPRLKYMESDSPLLFHGNILKIMEHARGDYVHTMSNDDLVNLEALPWVFETIRNPHFSLISGCTPKQAYAFYGMKEMVSNEKEMIFKKGYQAICGAFTSLGTYMSHYILNRRIYFSSGTHDYIKAHLEDSLLCRIYPSIKACILIAGMHGDIYAANQELYIKADDEPTAIGVTELGGKGYGNSAGFAVLLGDAVEILVWHHLQGRISWAELNQCVYAVYKYHTGIHFQFWHMTHRGTDVYDELATAIEPFLSSIKVKYSRHGLVFSPSLEGILRSGYDRTVNEYKYFRTKTMMPVMFAQGVQTERVWYR